MEYRVRITDRAYRDLETIYQFIGADSARRAFTWFNRLSEAIYSLERFPKRGSRAPEDKRIRQLIFGAKPNAYRILYTVDKRNGVVNVLHIRHGARAPLSREDS